MDKKIDSYDNKILFELDKNARISTTNLAKKLRKSKQFVDYRVKKLEQERVILGYTTVIDYSRLGYTSIRIYFKLHNITPEQQKAMEDELIKDKDLIYDTPGLLDPFKKDGKILFDLRLFDTI